MVLPGKPLIIFKFRVFLENMNIYVELIGSGNVIKQSVKKGVKVIEKSTVILELS